ncbi:SpoIIE family protein phosphatase [Pseudonocardia humida]|uniref:SpoIIE family protein phosphatase n=1 Tax=Pseudonocardia humida TaxID=2800819 RepID=A0ABT1ACJ8_9PSEU|nr:SpoIIE family protein phosphatase [Pseudonocardia humida]MCO1660509.1 SpoIIE family protein phosphatase [Pseudonocardia humida]
MDDADRGSAGGGSDRDGLSDPMRLQALERSGLGTAPDPVMEGFAARVRERLAVPGAFVSLVRSDQQVLPGVVGLPEPWASRRALPLSHAFCLHVVSSARPLVVDDARVHPLVRDNPAVPDLGIVAYAGMPLRDSEGNVLGALCAIDGTPREWSAGELETLSDLAVACSTELSLRLARYDAALERSLRDDLEQAQHRSFVRSQTLLAASQAFTDTATVDDVRERADQLVSTDLQPAYVGLALAVDHPDDPADARANRELEAAIVATAAVRSGRMLVHPDPDPAVAGVDRATAELLDELGLGTIVAAPLPGPQDVVGALVLGWAGPRALAPSDLLMIGTVAGYAARAVSRARVLAHRTGAAHDLQRAMLTTLPDVPGLVIAARYVPADSREDVGGDWYDAAFGPAGPPGPAGGPDEVLAVSVGDVIGHDLRAAALMGQARSMLRQALWDHPGGSASDVFSAFERANAGVALDAAGTAVLALLRRRGAGGWSMSWTNAGHPPPVLLDADGSTRLLPEHGMLFGYPALARQPRADHCIDLEPGSTLFLYTDGLVERRGRDLDAGTQELLELLDRNRGLAPSALVDVVVRTLATDSDDVVALAIGV